MKKVIDGALYNTETANVIGSIQPNGDNREYDHYYAETLYKTKAGKYFLHGEGQISSLYGQWRGNTRSWGEQIRSYTPQEARKWAEENLDYDMYSAEFGEPDEAGEGRVPLSLTVQANIKAMLEQMRSMSNKSISQIVSDLVVEEYGKRNL